MKLLVTDYDNTLELHYDFTDNEAILNRNKEAINNFMKENLVFIATGRHFDAIYKTLTEENIQFNYLCANNGAELYDNNYNLLFCMSLDKNDLNILKQLKEEKLFRNPFNSKLVTSVNFYFESIKKYEEIKDYLNNNLKESFCEYKYPKIKIINKKCNKVNAIDFIKEIIKIKDEDIYVIGDDVCDIEMISKYNGYSLNTANKKVKRVSSKIYDELSNLIKDIKRKN